MNTSIITQQPDIELLYWRVFATPKGHELVGYDTFERMPIASSPVESIDPSGPTLVTRSGRCYRLLGKPAAVHVVTCLWQARMNARGWTNTDVLDVSETIWQQHRADRPSCDLWPLSVTIGIEALRLAGWTTQVTYRPTVAVISKPDTFNTDPFEIVERDLKWFNAVGVAIEGDRALGMPTLRPAWALADMLHTEGWGIGKSGLWPDDIEWDQIEEVDELDWQAACAAIGLPYRALKEQAVASR
jgi:hypothetical protein